LLYTAGAVAIGAVLLQIRLSSDQPFARVEVPLSDSSMRPAIGTDITMFKVDPSWMKRPQRMSIVAFVPPGGGAPKVARAVALPGDELEVVGGSLRVNGARLEETARSVPFKDVPRFRVPRDCAYLLVDGERGSDSVELGPVPLWRILGGLKL